MKNILWFLCLAIVTYSYSAQAGITVSPFASISSTKKLSPTKKNSSSEDVQVNQRTLYGLKLGLSFFRILVFEASAGQSKLDSTFKTQDAVDDYDQIDYEKDLKIDTSDPELEVKSTEIQNRGSVSLAINPSFWIFIMRAKVGVVATQREVSLEQSGVKTKTVTPITYKPTAGAGAGVRINARMFALAEYNVHLYKIPETTPFEREVTVSYGVSF